MRAAVVEGPGRIRVQAVPRPRPGTGQVRIRVEGCGVCGSNVPLWEGRPWFQYPLEPGAPGHEGWGRVDQLGEGVEGLVPGQRVTFLSGHAFAEYDVASASDVVPLPDEVPGPFPGEPVACAFNVAARSGFAPGMPVAVVGIGFLGALVVRLAREAGARVVAVSRRPGALEVARAMGAEEVIPLTSLDAAVGAVMSWTGGLGCPVVVEATGLQDPLTLAGCLVGVRGRLVVAGYHQEARHIDMQRWNWNGLDVVNAHERDPARYVEGMRGAVAAAAAGRLDLAPLLTHTWALERLAEAFDAMLERPDGFLKATVTP